MILFIDTHNVEFQLSALRKRTTVYTDPNGLSTLIYKDEDTIEAVFVVQGVLLDFDLPPILKKTE